MHTKINIQIKLGFMCFQKKSHCTLRVEMLLKCDIHNYITMILWDEKQCLLIHVTSKYIVCFTQKVQWFTL